MGARPNVQVHPVDMLSFPSEELSTILNGGSTYFHRRTKYKDRSPHYLAGIAAHQEVKPAIGNKLPQRRLTQNGIVHIKEASRAPAPGVRGSGIDRAEKGAQDNGSTHLPSFVETTGIYHVVYSISQWTRLIPRRGRRSARTGTTGARG